MVFVGSLNQHRGDGLGSFATQVHVQLKIPQGITMDLGEIEKGGRENGEKQEDLRMEEKNGEND